MATVKKKVVIPKPEYESFAPRKTKELVEVQKILARPVFKNGSKRYAVRVHRDGPKGQSIGFYDTIVKANSITELRLKLIKNLNWDLGYKWPATALIYKNAIFDKYNHAGYLHPNLHDHSFFVWAFDDDRRDYDARVNARTGALTSQKYEQDTNVPYKRM